MYCGTAVADETGRPIPDIQLRFRDGTRVNTDLNGRFEVFGLAPGAADGSYEQQVPILGLTAEVTMERPDTRRIEEEPPPPDERETRVDPVLFAWSYDYVGDLAETAALIWPERPGAPCDFMLGQAETSGRDWYLYMGVDAEPISVKWKTLKVHFRYTEEYSWTAPYIKRQVPMVFDLINDPHEEIDLMDAEITYAWAIGVASMPLIQLAQSAAQFPNIPPGADFQGYDS